VAGGVAVRHQSGGEPDLHADSVRDAESADGGGGYSDRVGDNNLVRSRHMAALQMGRRRSGAVFRVGVAGNFSATVDHLDELGAIVMPVQAEAIDGLKTAKARVARSAVALKQAFTVVSPDGVWVV
jgi:hypothetical protein